METSVQKWGNSLGIRIPGPLARNLDLKQGTPVEILADKNRLVIRATHRQTLAEKLSGISKANIHDEVSSGPPRGREIW